MVDTEQLLPKFRRPPLIEVVHGVQFGLLPMTIVHPGLFYEAIRDRYPIALTRPPLAATREILDEGTPAPFSFSFLGPANLPRAWFASKDGTHLVQLQNDRLLLNWRRGEQSSVYPHFEQVSAEFQRLYQRLEAFVAENSLGVFQPNQCEVSYINHLSSHFEPVNPGEYIKIWNGRQGSFNEQVEDCALNLRFLIRNEDKKPVGRLIINMTTLPTPDRKRVLQLDMTARGAPVGGGLDGVVGFHKIAHEKIVRYFAEITTAEAQNKWERFV